MTKDNSGILTPQDNISKAMDEIETILDKYNFNHFERLQISTSYLISDLNQLQCEEHPSLSTITSFILDAILMIDDTTPEDSDIIDNLDNLSDIHILKKRDNEAQEKRSDE